MRDAAVLDSAEGETSWGFSSGVLQRRLGAPTHELVEGRGKLRIWVRADRGLLLTSAIGHGGVDLVPPFLRALDDAVGQGVREIWDDWARVTSYDSETRIRITAWTRANAWLAKNIHVLVGSKLIAMGVTVSNLALGGVMRITADRAAFERALFDRLRGC